MGDYKETAKAIIGESLKSAIFIDENAKEPFSNEDALESIRSEALYKNLKDKGIALSIYKYDAKTYNTNKDYIFGGRDLVLLDWKLEGESGEEKSLDILSEIVNHQPHIHFCVIYTSSSQGEVINNILSYFSGETKEQYDNLQEEFEDNRDTIKKLDSLLKELSIYRFDKNKRKNLIESIHQKCGEEFFNRVMKDFNPTSLSPFIHLGIAFDNLQKSTTIQPCPSAIDASSFSLCIGHTFISVFNKNKTSPKDIINDFSKQIVDNDKGIMLLLGLEMRNIQRRNEAYIDSQILSVSKEALAYHKNQKGDEFTSFIKEIMAEHLKMKIGGERLKIIDALVPSETNHSAYKNDYASMNTFYNSQRLDANNKALIFGDVFNYENDYYICITALCDCARPQKTNNYFYFAKGHKISVNEALELGESGYISYLGNECCVRWDDADSKSKSSHITPIPFYVPNNILSEGIIEAWRYIDGKENKLSFQYITTIRQNYAQRIANYAFSHPVRVGIDFVFTTNNDSK